MFLKINKVIDIENGDGVYECEAFSILHETNQILAITRIDYTGPEIAVIDSNASANVLMSWTENTQIRFEYPLVLFIKGSFVLLNKFRRTWINQLWCHHKGLFLLETSRSNCNHKGRW